MSKLKWLTKVIRVNDGVSDEGNLSKHNETSILQHTTDFFLSFSVFECMFSTPQPTTVMTNLQRGNVQTTTPLPRCKLITTQWPKDDQRMTTSISQQMF